LSLLGAVANLVESLQRLGLHGAVGMKREKMAARSVAAYFRVLAERMPVEKLSELAKAGHKEAAQHAAEITIRRALRGVQPILVEALASHKMLAYKEGYQQTVVKEAGEDQPFFSAGGINEKAADYAATSAAEQVKAINQTTLDTLQELIGEGIDARLSVEDLARSLVAELEDFSMNRARVIARTEMADAFSQSALDKLNDYNIEYKQWISYSDCCDDCSANEDDGAIPVDENFSSGDDAPPAHPNCRCTIAGARAPEEE
jgi:SPP1 gp7 family putative phage head morphogenesis protein